MQMSGNKAVECSCRGSMCEAAVCGEGGGCSAASGQQGALLRLRTHTLLGSQPEIRSNREGEKSSYDLLVHRSLPPERKKKPLIWYMVGLNGLSVRRRDT